MRKVKVGIIGCGVISQTYLNNFNRFKWVEVVACADMFIAKAEEVAKAYHVPKFCSVEELLLDPEVEIVVNLTIPAAHTPINIAALNAGKHVYCEKPLGLNQEEARQSIDLAAEKGLLLGCAPDTFLGAGLQSCRKIIDDGWIGEIVGATVNFSCPGHELWHPVPNFLYQPGGGPMMDMGPYYITAMVALLGPVKRLSCYAKKTAETRTVYSQPNAGTQIPVEVMTHYTGIMEFASGVLANINMSWDIWLSSMPLMEIYGTAGTLIVPNPNFYGGPVRLLRRESILDSLKGLDMDSARDKLFSAEMHDFFKEVPMPFSTDEGNLRGLGVFDMANAIIDNHEHRTNGKIASHVMEILTSFNSAVASGESCTMQTTCDRPDSMPVSLGIGH